MWRLEIKQGWNSVLSVVFVMALEEKKHPSEASVRAVDECIEEEIFADILISQKAEVLELALTTFDRELYEQGLREEGEGNLSELISALLDEGLDDVVRLVISDKVAREKYYQKYNIK